MFPDREIKNLIQTISKLSNNQDAKIAEEFLLLKASLVKKLETLKRERDSFSLTKCVMNFSNATICYQFQPTIKIDPFETLHPVTLTVEEVAVLKEAAHQVGLIFK